MKMKKIYIYIKLSKILSASYKTRNYRRFCLYYVTVMCLFGAYPTEAVIVIPNNGIIR